MTFTTQFGFKKVSSFFFLLLAFLLLSAHSVTDSNRGCGDACQTKKSIQEDKNTSKEKLPKHAYVLLQDSQSIGLLDLVSGEFEKEVTLDFPATILAVSSDGKTVYLSDVSKSNLYKIEFQSGCLKQLAAPKKKPHQIVILPQEELGYALYPECCDIVCLNLKKDSFSTWQSLSQVPTHIAFSSFANELFISCKDSSEIIKADLATSTISPFISLSKPIHALKLSSDEKILYSFQENGNSIEIVDLSSLQNDTISYSFPNDQQKCANKLVVADKENSLFIAKEKGSEIFAFDFKAKQLQEIFHFERPISSIAFIPEPKSCASFKVEGLNAGDGTLFDASATKSFHEGQVFYLWDFGDGQTAMTENPLIEHSYTLPGNYNVSLVAKQELAHQGSMDADSFSEKVAALVEIGQNQAVVSILPLLQAIDSKKSEGKSTSVIPAGRVPTLDSQLSVIPTATTLVNAPSPSIYGETVTLTATVSPLVGPTGDVTFFDGATQIGLPQTLSGSQAVLTISNLSVSGSPHSLTAKYNGDVNYAPSVSAPPNTQTVIQATPTLAITSSLNPSTYADNVTFTATVTAPFPSVISGTVQFYDNLIPIGTPQTLVLHSSTTARATLTLNTLSGGNHTITATYSGDANFTTVTGSLNSNPQVVNLANTSTTILSSSQSKTAYGQQFTLQAIVVGAPSSPPTSPSSTVSFYACPSAAPCGSPLLLGTAFLPANPNTNTSSVDFIYTGFLDVGNYVFYATYGGDTNYSSSTSSNISHIIVKTLTTSSTQFKDNCSNGTNSNVTLIATVSSNAPGSGTPDGSVKFYDGFSLLGTASLIPVNPSSSQASFPTPLSVGTHLITAIYAGSSNYAISTAPAISITTTIDSTTTSLALTNGNNPSAFGDSLTFTATVNIGCDVNGNTPTGTVTFTATGSTTTDSKVVSLSGSPATASVTICNLYPDTYSIKASYSGDSNFSSSISSDLNQQVTGVLDTTTTITASSENPVAICPDTTVFTAEVKAITNCPNLVVNGGSVNFYNNSTNPVTLIGTGVVVNGIATSGPVCFETTGAQSITAEYVPGAAPFTGSTSSPYSQCVTPYDTETILTIKVDNQESPTVTLTATVTALGSGPFPDFSTSGTVSFYDGTTLLQAINVPAGSNTSFEVSITAGCLGCRGITAVYSGENCDNDTIGNFDTSQDTVANIFSKTTTSVEVLGTAPYYVCQPITLQADVSSTCETGCSPTGVVAFFDGNYSLGSAALNSGVATLIVPSLPLGSHSISATYIGDSTYQSSSSSTPVSLTILQPSTTTTLSIAPNQSIGSVYGQTIIFGAQVTSPAGNPTTGVVSFSDENGVFATVEVDSKGKAIYLTNVMNAGTHTFTATYDSDCCSEDGCFGGSSDTISDYVIHQVLPKLALSGAPKTVTYGDVISLTATISSYSIGTPTGSMTFYLGSNALGTVPIIDGVANLRVSSYLCNVNIPTGANVIFVASYSGDTNFLPTNTNNWAETINKAPVTVAIDSESPNPSIFGQAVVFSASVKSLLNIPTDSGNSPVGIPPTGTVTFVIDGASQAPATIVNGVATFSTTTLTVGSAHSIVARYNGDSNFLSSQSLTYTQRVERVDTRLTVTSSSNPSTYNSSVSLTVTVNPILSGFGTPIGSVTITYGQNVTQTVALSGGNAVFTLSNLPVGANNITIVYSGNTVYNPSSTVYNQIVKPASTQITSGILPTNPVYGQPIALSASVTSTQGTPTGEVSFSIGFTTLGIGTLNAGNTLIPLENLSAGIYTVNANYAAQGNFDASLATVNFTIAQAATTTAIQTSEENSVYGRMITFTATVVPTAPGAGTPTGAVTFFNGLSPIGTSTVGIGGIATLSINSLSVVNSPYSISATYSGNSNFSGSTSSSIQQALILNSTQTQVSSSANPAVIGSTISLAVKVLSTNSQNIVPNGGTVKVYDGSDATPLVSGNVTNGLATLFLPTTLAAGTHSLTITYTDDVDANFGSSSTYFDQIINLGTTSTTIATSLNPSTYGQDVTFTATVTNTTALFNSVPNGKVNFIDNNMVIGTGILTAVSSNTAQASITLNDLSVGTHPITAVYLGDNNVNASSSSQLSQVINQAPTATAIVLNNPNPSQFGEQVTFIATITANPAQPANSLVNKPTGTVSFYDTVIDTAHLLGTVPANGIAIFDTDQLAVSFPFSHNILAVYNGDANYLTSTSAAVPQMVTNTSQTSTTLTTVTSNPNPANYGCPINFTIHVKPIITPVPYPGPPTGTVYLYLAAKPLTPVGLALDPATGNASVTIPSSDLLPLPAGNLEIVAIYSGDTFYSSSTAVYEQVVNPIPVNLALNSSINPSVVNQQVTLNALLTANPSCPSPITIIPTGSVSFYDGLLPGGTLLGTTTINSVGLASLIVDDLSIGSHSITAVYNPDPNFTAASSTLQQNVLCLPTQTQILNAYPNPVVEGNEIVIIAGVSTVVNEDILVKTGAPVGTVTFYDTINGAGPHAIGTISLSNGIAILNISNLTKGIHNITAVYSGSKNFCSSALAAPGYQQVVLESILPVNISVTSSLNPAEYGQEVVFTATVTDPSHEGVPTGTVTFFDGTEAIGTSTLVNGVAELPISDLSIGDHPITAVYNGDEKYKTETSAVYIQVIIASPYPLPPHDFKGCQVINKYLNFNERVNILTWEPPQDNEGIARYEIYRDAKLKHLAGVVKHGCPYRFEDKNRKKGRTYKYYIVSVNRNNKKSTPVYTKVIPKDKRKEK